MNEQEATFVKAFVARECRERCSTLLASRRGRRKIRTELAHTFASYLDPRYVYEEQTLPLEIKRKVDATLKRAHWSTQSLCYVICEREDADGREMTLGEAEAYHAHWYGIIISLVPGEMAYYRTEGRDPDYVLYREAAQAAVL